MSTAWAEKLVAAVGVYGLLGVVFALAFVTAGVGRVDASARGTGIGFRLLIAPGAAAFWPLLLTRWLRGNGQPGERNAHRDGARR